MTSDHVAETDAIVAELERAGLVTGTQREDGKPVYPLTPQGEQVARPLAMNDEAGQDAVLEALLRVRE